MHSKHSNRPSRRKHESWMNFSIVSTANGRKCRVARHTIILSLSGTSDKEHVIRFILFIRKSWVST
jgi:hypothetical protein